MDGVINKPNGIKDVAVTNTNHVMGVKYYLFVLSYTLLEMDGVINMPKLPLKMACNCSW